MKKLITVTWSRTVEVDLPIHLENVSTAELENPNTEELISISNETVESAGADLDWKDGEITDIQDL